MKIEVGDRVEIINPYACYSTSKSWVKQFAPEYLQNYRVNHFPQEIYKKDKNKNVFSVVAKEENEERKIEYFLIQAYNGYVYLVNDKAIKLIDYYLQEGDIVNVINTRCVYTDFEAWLKQNNVPPELIKNYTKGALPVIGGRYRIIAKAFKAEFSPFNNKKICLICELVHSKRIFIIEEQGLLKSFD
ncbi:MAG: hypothetical protein ACI37Z_05025 [Candidatus Gastranaerophilaceae bacterium]